MSLINEMVAYRDGRVFPHSLLFTTSNGVSMARLREADVWHIHNYLSGPLKRMKRRQSVVAQFHSLPRLGNWKALMEFADKCYTISQPLQKKEYKLPSLPNVIDPDEYYPVKKSIKISIAFAPSSRAPVSLPCSKGYHEVKKILDQVAAQRDVEIVWIEGQPYMQNLRMKARSHILIDDVVTGNWHRTSLEGACFGCVVLNKVRKEPFVYTNLKTLETELLWLIDNPKIIERIGEMSRLWILQEWHPIECVGKYIKAYKDVSHRGK